KIWLYKAIDMQFWMIKDWAMDFSARGTITNQWKPTWREETDATSSSIKRLIIIINAKMRKLEVLLIKTGILTLVLQSDDSQVLQLFHDN
ncbi:14456_t:CDS:2, partial [Funneliformis mosseae]